MKYTSIGSRVVPRGQTDRQTGRQTDRQTDRHDEYKRVATGISQTRPTRSHANMSIIVQQYETIYSFIIFLRTALHVSDGTLIHHQQHTQTVITTSGTVRTVFATVRSDVEESEPKHVKMFAEI